MENIKETIKRYEEEIELGNLTRQRKRFLEDQIEELKLYLELNPEKDKVPTNFEIYCSLNPEADECREYDV